MLDFATIKTVDLIDLTGRDTNLRGGPKEYAGPCPKCGGTDRFHVHVERGWFCRHCTQAPGEGGHWMDALDYVMFRDGCDFVTAYSRLGIDAHLTPDEARRLQEEREERERERLAEERRQQEEKRAALAQSKPWETFYRNLERFPEAREMWHRRGLSDLWIDYFQVGYTPAYTFYHDGHPFSSPTLTIPTFKARLGEPNPQGRTLTWDCVGLVHRLLIDPAPGGKYRPHMAGLGKPLFYCDLYAPIHGDVILVEGEIKAAVTWAHLQDYVYEMPGTLLGRTQVVGTAGKSFKEEWIGEFDLAERIYICMDPDTNIKPENAGKDWKPASAKIASMLGPARCRIIHLPGKIDDLLVNGSITAADLPDLMETARRVSG